MNTIWIRSLLYIWRPYGSGVSCTNFGTFDALSMRFGRYACNMDMIWIHVYRFGYDMDTEMYDLDTIWIRDDLSREKYGYGWLPYKNLPDV